MSLIKIFLFIFTILSGSIAWAFFNTYKTSTIVMMDTLMGKIDEQGTGKTDQSSEMMDGKIKDLDTARSASVAADTVFKAYTGTQSNNPQLLDGAKQIVEMRKQELVVKESSH